MHIKTNVEMSFVHIVILAICPLLIVMQTANQALYYIAATAICFFISSLVCWLFNRHLSRSVKIFITAILSSFLITLFNYLIGQNPSWGLKVNNNSYYAIITTIILSTDIIYIDTKALTGNFFFKIIRAIFAYALLTLIYVIVGEFLSFGTVFGERLFKYKGYEFFKTITFHLIWLGIVCFLAELVNRTVSKRVNEKKVTYQKFIKKIRNEKVFQYDNLRRKRLLISEIDTNKIDGEKIEEIKEKESENETIEVEDIKEETESTETVSTTKKKKNKKLKFSKETKIEKVYDRQAKEDK